MNSQMNWFEIAAVEEKIRNLPKALSDGLKITGPQKAFCLGRDVQVVPPSQLPAKPGLVSKEGQARLFHDLASIELQAMELAVRTLYEYPEAPREFREQLAEIAEGEGRHLGLCLRGMEDLGYQWGNWNVHNTLWNAVGESDTLLDRILIVHRYLEGSGLDAGESILRRLKGIGFSPAKAVVEVIVREEVDHVNFGSLWYRRVASAEGIDPERDFAKRIEEIARVVPRRERIARDLRLKAGFTEYELSVLESFST